MENFYNNALYGDGRAKSISEGIEEEEEEQEHGQMQREDNSVVGKKLI